MAVTSQILEQGAKNVVMHFTNDGDAEDDVTKVDVSALTPPCTRVAIERIQWSIGGAAGLALEMNWVSTAEELIWVMPSASSDAVDFCGFGGLQNPMSAAATGDISFAVAADAPYTVTLWMKKKYD